MSMTVELFWSKVERRNANECWPWLASKRGKGYGYIRWNGKSENAHRVAWEITHGPVLKMAGHHGICVLHRCDNPTCVNPGHLYLGTNQDNAVDRQRKGRTKIDPRAGGSINKAKTHCTRGHAYSGSNLYITPDGRRDCRKCDYIRKKKYRARLMEGRL